MFCLFLKASEGMNANWEGDVCKFMQIHLQISTYHQSLGMFPASLCWSRRDWGGTEQDEGQWKCCGPSQQDPEPWDGVGCTGVVFLLPFSPFCTISTYSLCPGTHGSSGTRQGLTPAVQFASHHPSSSINFTSEWTDIFCILASPSPAQKCLCFYSHTHVSLYFRLLCI